MVAQKDLEEAKRQWKDEKEAFDNAYWEHMRKSPSAAKKERDGMKGDQSAGKEDMKEFSSYSSCCNQGNRGRRRNQDNREQNRDGDCKRYRYERDRRDNDNGDCKRSHNEKDKRDADKDQEMKK
eukprot:10255340-Ditylum_brightwellii.AAC.1